MIERRIIGQFSEGTAGVGVGEFLSKLKPTQGIFQGKANISLVYVDQTGVVGKANERYLRRRPKDRTAVTQELKDWYTGVGFMGEGKDGQFYYLSTAEQAEKMDDMHNMGLKTVFSVVSDGEEMVLPFIEGETLLDYINGGKTNVVPAVVDHLLLAHQKGFVLGDRWTPNTIVTRDGDFREIDFDIQLSGRYAKEFELSQLLYSLVVYSTSRTVMMGVMHEYLPRRKYGLETYNKDVLTAFLRGHATYLEGKTFEGCLNDIKDEVEEIIGVVKGTNNTDLI